MNILQRITTLVRANLHDLIDRAEDPEKMIKQLIIDLNNQLIQTKTMVAQSLADQYMLENKLTQTRREAEDYEKRAELAVQKNDDSLARMALQRMNSYAASAGDMERQLDEQRMETDMLKQALMQLETKVAEVTRERDLLLARQRRASTRERMTRGHNNANTDRVEELLDAITGYVEKSEASARAYTELHQESAEHRLNKMEEDNKLDRQLAELKSRHQGVIQLE